MPLGYQAPKVSAGKALLLIGMINPAVRIMAGANNAPTIADLLVNMLEI
jgi:hypothetical protein